MVPLREQCIAARGPHGGTHIAGIHTAALPSPVQDGVSRLRRTKARIARADPSANSVCTGTRSLRRQLRRSLSVPGMLTGTVSMARSSAWTSASTAFEAAIYPCTQAAAVSLKGLQDRSLGMDNFVRWPLPAEWSSRRRAHCLRQKRRGQGEDIDGERIEKTPAGRMIGTRPFWIAWK